MSWKIWCINNILVDMLHKLLCCRAADWGGKKEQTQMRKMKMREEGRRTFNRKKDRKQQINSREYFKIGIRIKIWSNFPATSSNYTNNAACVNLPSLKQPCTSSCHTLCCIQIASIIRRNESEPPRHYIRYTSKKKKNICRCSQRLAKDNGRKQQEISGGERGHMGCCLRYKSLL